MKEEFDEIRSKLYDLHTTFSKARGEWNDGYAQGVMDALSIVGQVSRKESQNNFNNNEIDIELFKKNYFGKKGFSK